MEQSGEPGAPARLAPLAPGYPLQLSNNPPEEVEQAKRATQDELPVSLRYDQNSLDFLLLGPGRLTVAWDGCLLAALVAGEPNEPFYWHSSSASAGGSSPASACAAPPGCASSIGGRLPGSCTCWNRTARIPPLALGTRQRRRLKCRSWPRCGVGTRTAYPATASFPTSPPWRLPAPAGLRPRNRDPALVRETGAGERGATSLAPRLGRCRRHSPDSLANT